MQFTRWRTIFVATGLDLLTFTPNYQRPGLDQWSYEKLNVVGLRKFIKESPQVLKILFYPIE